ncbi:MAG: hypothetical protein EXS14_02595 [Planctomycetes bacterium]|nr:hypothetical protein [Planctomycetota bacterium]
MLRLFGITPRLLLIVVAILCPALLVVALVAGRTGERELHTRAEGDVAVLARTYARLLAEVPLSTTVEDLRRDVFDDAVRERQDLAGMALYESEPSGRFRQIATSWVFGDELVPLPIDSRALERNLLLVEWRERDGVPHVQAALPLLRDGRPHVLHIEVRHAGLDNVGAATAEAAVLAGFAGLALAGVLVLLIVRFSVEKPIDMLGTAMRQVRSIGAGRTLPVRSEDLFGGLIRNFNDMTIDLKHAESENRALMRDLRDFNRDLELRVSAATEDLLRKNSELLATQERLMGVQQEVSRLERLASLGQLSTTLAHELATPMNVVSGHLEILEREVPEGSPARPRVRTLSLQVARLSGILKEVLTAVRLPDPVPTTVELDPVLDEIMRFMAPMAGAHGVKLERLGAEHCSVRFDRNQLQQVLLNLVTNAIEATPEDGRVAIEVDPPVAGMVMLRVRDSGEGIAPEALARVFEPFFTTKEIGHGQGLGLAISHEILRKNGGAIRASNHAAGGALFELSLPAL